MKKLVLGVVALCVAMNVAWAIDYCYDYRSRYAKCLKYESGDRSYDAGCRDKHGSVASLENLRMQLEACLVQYGR